MALPNLFFNVTQATGAQLDANFAALGALTPIPCTVSGTNTLVLTTAANTPSVTAYSNYMQFTAVAGNTNTGAATGKVGSLAQLPIYKNSVGGPIALTGGEIVANVPFILLYDSALGGGTGGFHLLGAAVIAPSGGTVSGPIVGTGSLATITYPAAVFPLLTGVTLSSITHLSLGGGPTISSVLSTTASIAFAATNPQTSSEATIPLTGCSVGDNVLIGYPASVASAIIYRGYVPNAGTVALVAGNISSGTVTPTPGTYRATVIRF